MPNNLPDMYPKMYFLCIALLLFIAACKPDATTSTAHKTDPKAIDTTFYGYWKNATYFDSLQQQGSVRFGQNPFIILQLDSLYGETLGATNQYGTIGVVKFRRVDHQTLAIDSLAKNDWELKVKDKNTLILQKKGGTSNPVVFNRIVKNCIYDDAPFKIQLVARCQVNAALLYGWYDLLDEKGQRTNRLVSFNDGGGLRGLGDTIDVSRLCMDSICLSYSKNLNLTWLEKPNVKLPIDSTNFSQYYTWQRNQDTLSLYHTINKGSKKQPDLVRGNLVARMVARKK